MGHRFPGDKNLADLFKGCGWSLYDITTTLPKPVSFSWEELAGNEADYYLISHRYYLLPLPEEGETLKQAYTASRKNSTYPILHIPKTKPKEKQRLTLEAEDGFGYNDFTCYYLNEFYFQEDSLSASSSIFFSHDYPSRVIIPAKQAVEVFINYFSLIKFAKDGGMSCIKPLQKYIH